MAENSALDTTLAVIMAGGRGQRMGTLGRYFPKVLSPFRGEPVIFHQIRNLKSQGVGRISVVCGHLGWIVERVLREEFGEDESISFYQEGNPRGNAFALAELTRDEEDFILLNGDCFLPIHFFELMSVHKNASNALTVVSLRREHQSAFGVLTKNEEGEVIGFQEKPVTSYDINAGVYAVSSMATKITANSNDFSVDLWIELLQKNALRIGSFEASGEYIHFTSLEDIRRYAVDE
jgi:NDP-sugar pyrophosphorylase family protein